MNAGIESPSCKAPERCCGAIASGEKISPLRQCRSAFSVQRCVVSTACRCYGSLLSAGPAVATYCTTDGSPRSWNAFEWVAMNDIIAILY